MPRTRKFTDEEFVRAWKEAPSLEAVARRFGLVKETATNIAIRLRAQGHDLKRFKKQKHGTHEEVS